MVNSMSVLSKAPWSIWGCKIHRNGAFFISWWHWENFKLIKHNIILMNRCCMVANDRWSLCDIYG